MTDIKPSPKKSVALSGVIAGDTALCTVGRTGNDLHYRGYDILDVAETCEFEEIAYLLVHGSLPTLSELRNYKAKLKALRGLPLSALQAPRAAPRCARPGPGAAARRRPPDGRPEKRRLRARLHPSRGP